MAAVEGTGAAVTFGSTGITVKAISIQNQGITWEAIPTTYLGTTNAKTFVRGDLYDPGSISVTFQTEPEELDHYYAASASETITITYPDTGAAAEVATGFITQLDPASIEVDNIITGTLTIKRTGTIVLTP